MSPPSSMRDIVTELISHTTRTNTQALDQTYWLNLLNRLGFTTETLTHGTTQSLWAKKGNTNPIAVLAAPLSHFPLRLPETNKAQAAQAQTNEQPDSGVGTEQGAVAALISAAQHFTQQHPEHADAIALLIGLPPSSQQPGQDSDLLSQTLHAQAISPRYCLMAEPTSEAVLGDTIKNGRRGCLSAHLQIHGQAGHLATPQFARNPIHLLMPALHELTDRMWDAGNIDFPPTTLQISQIQAGTKNSDLSPASLDITLHFYFGTEQTVTGLQTEVEWILKKHQLNFEAVWTLEAEPTLSQEGTLSQALRQAIFTEADIQPALSSSGGMSASRFLAKICPEVIEFGPIAADIPNPNAPISLADLDRLEQIYRRTLEILLCPTPT